MSDHFLIHRASKTSTIEHYRTARILTPSVRSGGHDIRVPSDTCSARQGAMLILVAIMLVVLIVMTAFSIDVAYMQLVRTELRTATDAAAHAASESLVRTQSLADARQAAKDAARFSNDVAGNPLQLEDADVVFGHAVPTPQGAFRFAPVDGHSIVNAVRIRGHRMSTSPTGSVPLFLGSLLGRRTFEPRLYSTSTSMVRDIALVLDRSGSMQTAAKIDSLKQAVAVFLSVLEATPSDERVSLTTYSTTATKDVDLTSNLDQVRTIVQGLPAQGYTAIGQGLQLGTDSLEFDANVRPYAEKTIVLMTDGIENRPPNVMSIVPQAVARDHTVHTVTFGAGADQNLMRQVADDTGGIHRHAASGTDLESVFREIAQSLAVVLIE